MKKRFAHTELSGVLCAVCGKALKKRLVEASDKRRLCYVCWQKRQASRGHFMASGNQVRELVRTGEMRSGATTSHGKRLMTRRGGS